MSSLFINLQNQIKSLKFTKLNKGDKHMKIEFILSCLTQKENAKLSSDDDVIIFVISSSDDDSTFFQILGYSLR